MRHQGASVRRILIGATLLSLVTGGQLKAQTYFPLSGGNFTENFTGADTWASPATGSWSGVAVNATGTIPDGVKIVSASTTFQASNSSSGGLYRTATNVQLLSTGASPENSTSAAYDLNLNFNGRITGNLSFNAAMVSNGANTSNRAGTLRVYYSLNGTTFTEITGGGLPYSVVNFTTSSASINVALPTAVEGQSTVKLRFYYSNGTGGSSGSRPKISIDDVVVSSASNGVDVTPPVVSSLSPSDGAINVAGATTLQMNFNELIVAGTGTIRIYKADTTLVDTLTVGTSAVVISGTSVTITPTASLPLGTDYYVQVSSGAFTDAALNAYAGISNATAWNFKTIDPDITPPTIVSTVPTNSATGVTPTSSISVTFNEPIQTPFTAANFIVKRADNSTFATVSSSAFGTLVNTSGNTATITLPTILEYGTSYYVEIEPGAIEDSSSNPFAGYTGSATWSFTTVNVPSLTATAYTQNFSTFTSATNLTSATSLLPLGWSVSGPDLSYDGDFGTGTTGGFRGNASVLAYQHTGSTGVLVETLTLRNGTVDPITDLVVSYVGRDNGPATLGSRTPAFVVSVNGTPVTGLAYSTASGDNVTRTATISGLSIAPNATFSISWSSDGPNAVGTGSRRQIGISNVSVGIGVQLFAPTVTNSFTTGSLSYASAGFSGEVTADGGDPVTARGFVYSLTSANAAPTIGGTGVTAVADGSPGVGTFSATATGLTAASGYTFRAYATNTIGTTYGNALTFTTLATPPNFTTAYTQLFAAYNGSNPAGWSTVSSGGAQSYAGAWGNTWGSAGFTGGDSSPGVLGYQHTGGTGTLTTTLTLINHTGATLDQLYIRYLGRASRITEGRYPAFVVSVNGTPVSALAYSTFDGVDTTVSTTLTGLGIASEAPFTISWVSDRGLGGGSSKQIGLTNVYVGLSAPAGYTAWSDLYAPGQAANLDHDNDGVPNGVEFFMGATGSTFTANPGVVAGAVTWTKGGTYTGVYGTNFVLQSSPDLSTWAPIPSNDPRLSDTSGSVSYTLPTTPGPFFVRLSVTP